MCPHFCTLVVVIVVVDRVGWWWDDGRKRRRGRGGRGFVQLLALASLSEIPVLWNRCVFDRGPL